MFVRFQPVTSIFDEIDTLMNSRLVTNPSVKNAYRSGRFGAISVKENGDQVDVIAELPGVAKQDVSVNINDTVLTIKAERKQPELQDQQQWIRNEIAYGTFERTITLPYSVDVDKVSAVHENGILTIVLPKHESAKPKQISIR